MAEIWSDFWWAIVLFVLLIAGGEIRWSRRRNDDRD